MAIYPQVQYDVQQFRSPFGALCFGPTGCGKTRFIVKLLTNQETMFTTQPTRIVFAYSEWQTSYDEILRINPSVEFIKNIKEIFDNEHFFSNSEQNLLIMDDLASFIAKNEQASNLFTRGIHHKNIDVIHICQNMFQQGKSMRNLHLNSSYLILFKNARDVNQVAVLARQTGRPDLTEAYAAVTTEPFQPLVIDLKPDCPDYLRIRSHIFPGEDTRIYADPSVISVPEECLRK